MVSGQVRPGDAVSASGRLGAGRHSGRPAAGRERHVAADAAPGGRRRGRPGGRSHHHTRRHLGRYHRQLVPRPARPAGRRRPRPRPRPRPRRHRDGESTVAVAALLISESDSVPTSFVQPIAVICLLSWFLGGGYYH